MKAILTLIFVLFIGVAAQAQDANDNVKVETATLSIVSTTNNEMFNEVSTTTQNDVARLYKNKNARVLKALTFTTKKNNAKLA
ncbi:hypothetical protein SB49_06900 [Sediminicola sp. YIK13]|uniref:hypothetical protein n=1 Tax=Sediminicola sp. YIK13 TaxID=1453352 RepID=UPI00072227B8|nr:hypothetical protein [Sediminicola sp. YIK13]ALM07557.1 hypothetical protein SB49_06895 [Sediminicola sp. YIK13]ALM07558.1 hypothetical protein SB49_06900 [Sediminicola sp. YIK13]